MKWFPDDVNVNLREWWSPEFSITAGNKTRLVVIREVKSAECPRSIVDRDAESRKLVKIISDSKSVQNGTGATIFGPDSGKWPAAYYDAVTIFSNYMGLEESAAREAFND